MTSGPAVDAYLREVAAGLPGPRRARGDILAELRSGLLDAADAHRCAGLTAQAAAEAAITEFGDPRQVARAFRPHLAMTQARRTAVALAATGPLVGLLWAAAALASHITFRHAPPWQWPGTPPLSPAVFPAAGAAILIVIASVLATVAATGKLTRWFPARPRSAAATAATAGFGVTAADLAVLTLLASQLASAPGTLAPLPVAAATAASLTRLTLARRAARRCLAIRATLSLSVGQAQPPHAVRAHEQSWSLLTGERNRKPGRTEPCPVSRESCQRPVGLTEDWRSNTPELGHDRSAGQGC